MMKKLDKEKLEGHPMDWDYPTRLLWKFSYTKKIVYKPVIERGDDVPDYHLPPFPNFQRALGEIYISSVEMMPHFNFLCVDLRDWQETHMSWRVICGIWSQDGNYEDEGGSAGCYDEHGHCHDKEEWPEEENPDLIQYDAGCLVPHFFDYLHQGFQVPRVCVSGSLVSECSTFARVGDFCGGTIILHDFRFDNDIGAFPECETLILDFHDTISEPQDRLNVLQRYIGKGAGVIYPRYINRILVTQGPHELDDTTREVYRKGMDQLLQAGADRLGRKVNKTMWEFLESKGGRIHCEGCGRESFLLLKSTRGEGGPCWW